MSRKYWKSGGKAKGNFWLKEMEWNGMNKYHFERWLYQGCFDLSGSMQTHIYMQSARNGERKSNGIREK